MAEGYIHGSNLLVFIGGKAIGHCTSCTITHNTESKERAVKPASTVANRNTGKWTEKSVTKLSESISGEGFCFYNEAECGYRKLIFSRLKNASAVALNARWKRANASITSMSRSKPSRKSWVKVRKATISRSWRKKPKMLA